ncbi:cytochrome P450 [Chachezhania sediminis]|uniref:cytochrome P450 n=1 Tax=Chachezhania sediminis TaxID=2599291 RepID=UPI00131B8926|nr:cytochrome P450 [Chachezhania sediminis]
MNEETHKMFDVAACPTLADYGFTGGRDNFHAFCARIFRDGSPRFLRTDDGELVVFRNADLVAFGTSALVGNVPVGAMYPSLYRAGAAGRLPGAEVAEVISSQVFTFNPPTHGPARMILAKWLGPRQVALMEPLARDVAAELVARAQAGAEVEFVTEFAEAMTIRFWGALLRMTPEDTADLERHAHAMTALFHLQRTSGDIDRLDTAFRGYRDNLNRAADRLLAEGDAEMTALWDKVQALDFPDDPHRTGVLPKTLGDFLAGNLVDGVHTAALAAANTFYVLSTCDAARTAFRDDPAQLPKIIAEALRMEPPVMFLKRYVLEDFDHAGTTFAAGQQVIMMWAAGNNDPAVFADPRAFDLSRRAGAMTTFGNGAHICPGRYLGLMLARVLIETFRDAGIEIAVPEGKAADWYPAHMMNQIRAMPVILRRAGGQ